ncbi:MAG: hypothetical protein M1821_001198 [Bathelium mastoideum]|nr:MAG: hypothetical protein M1821_001198 [Bathelium mastoideum]KAI9689722.1 MAG: hypothetical protein M1822_009603 [Bathelium mastoideum]
MLSRALRVGRPLSRTLRPSTTPGASLLRAQVRYASQAEIEDPDMNGGYPNPPAVKRQHRDPYTDWWDKQERRNFGETVHEDNDILGVFSPEDYTHFSPAWGAVLFSCFVGSVAVLMTVVYQLYPDMPATPRTYPDGLEKELGGSNTVTALKEGDDLL